jgi:hypothetical protein
VPANRTNRPDERIRRRSQPREATPRSGLVSGRTW